MSGAAQAAASLRSGRAIRERCRRIYDFVEAGDSAHFRLDRAQWPRAVELVADVTRERYPDLAIPYHSRWRHFSVGGRDRLTAVAGWAALPVDERLRAAFDLAVTSVLLDAGAGPAWRYREGDASFGRSEGLAVASFHAFFGGAFSSDANRPWRADAEGLARFTPTALAHAFQVRDDNPLVGLEGRANLVRSVGEALLLHPELFSNADGLFRIGHLADTLVSPVSADALLEAVLVGLGSIWPSRLTLEGIPLGDVWRHPAAGGEDLTAGLVPFHKLSQWLTYSLVEPLMGAGIEVVGLDSLTGLAEYRNGGLFVDTGVVVPRDPALVQHPLPADHTAVIEWRALTICLLDDIAVDVRGLLDAPDLPLASILEGGTWAAGRRIASELRPGGTPPIQVASDGTVF